MITYQYYKEFGFDQQKLRDRLRLCELNDDDKEIAETLQSMVITPSIDRIADEFYDYLMSHREYREFIQDATKLGALKKTQMQYLASLGEDFHEPAYFDIRLRVGVAHNRIGMPLVLYEASYRKLRTIILNHIPREINDDLRRKLIDFCQRIISLDMTLAIDSYYQANVQEMKSRISHLEVNKKRLQVAAETDPLTHISNRSGLMTAIYNNIEHARRMGRPLVIVMLDIDKLGDVNDQYGHLVGDYLLKEVTQRVRENLPVNTEFGRYGGDEFMIILPNHTMEEALAISTRIQTAIKQKPFHVGNIKLEVSVSQGLCSIKNTDELVGIFRSLDSALHAAKQNGGNHIEKHQAAG